jgi:uncharacterized membrane protein
VSGLRLGPPIRYANAVPRRFTVPIAPAPLALAHPVLALSLAGLIHQQPWLTGIAFNTALLLPAYFLPKKILTPAGYVHAWCLGVLLWGCFNGWTGELVMLVYLALGSGVTYVGMAQKQAAGIAEARSGARGPENLWGSALTAALCALAFWVLKLAHNQHMLQTQQPNIWFVTLAPLLLLAYVASISTKLSDTFGSEIGKAYGQRTFLITTLQPVPRGTEGAVSLEGTVAGIGASLVIALTGWAVGLIPHQQPVGILICLVAAFVATNLESVIGATVQSKFDWLTNELVNVFNTLIGAGVAMAIAAVIGYAPIR